MAAASCPRRADTSWTHNPGSTSRSRVVPRNCAGCACAAVSRPRSEEHTSELQSHHDLVCRLLLEKKKTPNPASQHSDKTISAPCCSAHTSERRADASV